MTPPSLGGVEGPVLRACSGHGTDAFQRAPVRALGGVEVR